MRTIKIEIEIGIVDGAQHACCNCTTCRGAWIYCPIFNQIVAADDTFDETGETQGCTFFSRVKI